MVALVVMAIGFGFIPSWLIWGNNGWGGNGFGGNKQATGYLANQISNSEGRDLLLQAINGRS